MNSPLVLAEVDLAAIDHNTRKLRRLIDKNVHLMAVVKANAYGHGIREVAKQTIQSGADYLGVARISEGIQLNLPIPAYVPEDYLPEEKLRLRLYRRLAGVSTLEGIEEMARELEDHQEEELHG